MNKSLRTILKPAYAPCPGFSGACASMRWSPESGHVPRGFYGALGNVSEVRLVMVLAEPSDPGGDEIHSGIDSAFSYAEQCYLGGGGQGHTNTMSIIGRCFPGLPPQEAMRKVWITESVLCSAKTPGVKVDRACEQLCVSTYLEPQLRLFPNATVAAMGSKAYKRLKKHVPDIVECGAVFPPGCNFPSTKAKWDRLVSIVRSTTGETKGEGQKPRLDEEFAWRQNILNDQDFMKAQGEAQEKAALWEEYIKLLLLPENEEALRKFLMPIARDVAASMAKKSESKLNVEGWVNYQVSHLRKNKKNREKFIRDVCG